MWEMTVEHLRQIHAWLLLLHFLPDLRILPTFHLTALMHSDSYSFSFMLIDNPKNALEIHRRLIREAVSQILFNDGRTDTDLMFFSHNSSSRRSC